jgi:serine/threonine-protein kinase
MGGLDLLSVTNNGFEGRVLGNRYRIIRHLGRGGMADVYLGTDLVENIDVAIKILKPENSHDAEFLRRFETEARAVASLAHPNIVQVYGIGEDAGIHYKVMEYIQGITLKELLQQCVRLDWDTAVPIAIQIGLALEHAHSKGIIHRDIKPQNIMITPDVKAKVTDFGIARASSANTITMTGAGALGSVHYFPSEQAAAGWSGRNRHILTGNLHYELERGDHHF